MLLSGVFDADAILAIAARAYQAGRFADAKRGYKTALTLRPDDASILHLLGLTEIQLGRVSAGIESIERAILHDPNQVDYYRSLALAFTRLGRFGDAAKASSRAFMLAPANAEAYRRLIWAILDLVNREERWRDLSALGSAENDTRSVSIVTCSVNAQKARRIRSHYEALFAGRNFEIIQIYDARSLCEGYNRGFVQTTGDVVIFSHDDIEIVSADFAARLLRHLSSNDVVGVAGTSHLTGACWNSAGWPHVHGCVAHPHDDGKGFTFHCFGPTPSGPAEALDGLFIAANRTVCEAIPFDEGTFDGFNLYDLDFTYRAFLAGFRIVIPWDILIIHSSGGRLDAKWQKQALKFLAKYQGNKIILSSPPEVTWPYVQFSDRTQMIKFHRAMTVAQSVY